MPQPLALTPFIVNDPPAVEMPPTNTPVEPVVFEVAMLLAVKYPLDLAPLAEP